MDGRIEQYFDDVARLGRGARATDAAGNIVPLGAVFRWAAEAMPALHARGNKVMFVGNGGSAAISSHMAVDYAKNGDVRAMALNDPAALTCLANDYGYENVFAKQVETHGAEGDLLVAISSSGSSPNILNAVAAARAGGCKILTFSGFAADNPLCRAGDYNLHVASRAYGHVEVTHMALCHAILDIALGGSMIKPLVALG